MDPASQDRLTTLAADIYVALVEKLMRKGVDEPIARQSAEVMATKLALVLHETREAWED